MTIPSNLKPGAVISCNCLPVGIPTDQPTFVVTGYVANPKWGRLGAFGVTVFGVTVEGFPNLSWGASDQGWALLRWDLVRDADGGDYQPDDDVDLQPKEARP